MRILLDAINNRLDTVKEKVSKLLDIKVEIIQNKAERKKSTESQWSVGFQEN